MEPGETKTVVWGPFSGTEVTVMATTPLVENGDWYWVDVTMPDGSAGRFTNRELGEQ